VSEPVIRPATPADRQAAYYVCLKTGDHGQDGEPFYRDDPDALGRIYVGPYLEFEPESSLVLEDDDGVCGYALGAVDSRAFYRRYDTEWRPRLCEQFPQPEGDKARWTRTQQTHHAYHQPDFYCPEPYGLYPSHVHIDLLARVQGRGFGRRMLEQLMTALRRRGSPGTHLGVSAMNRRAAEFYRKLGFRELVQTGHGDDAVIYMGKTFDRIHGDDHTRVMP
jgi:ribosomal protein S18 acetylase RimI-like enzyme